MWDGLKIGQLFCELTTGYIIGYFDQAMNPRQFSSEALANKAQLTVLKNRRRGELGQDEARELFTEAEELRESPSVDHLHGVRIELMTNLFGNEWWHLTNDTTEPNPDYAYLERIIHAVQQALRKERQYIAV